MYTWLRQIRVYQWAKNVLVFLPMVAAHRLSDPDSLEKSLMAFLAFSLCASAAYVINDLKDLASDRIHPKKRFRPIASGALSLRDAKILAFVLLVSSAGIALQLPRLFMWILVGYFMATLLYSFWIKRIALLDVLLLAGLYTLRIYAGSSASGIDVSEWLLAFSMFLFLSLALVKRFTELQFLSSGEIAAASRRGYSTVDLQIIPIMGIASGFLTSLVMALYVSGDHVRSLYRHPEILWLICPILLYWIGRVWLLCHRGKVDDDPVVFALRDPVSYVAAGITLLLMAAAS